MGSGALDAGVGWVEGHEGARRTGKEGMKGAQRHQGSSPPPCTSPCFLYLTLQVKTRCPGALISETHRKRLIGVMMEEEKTTTVEHRGHIS